MRRATRPLLTPCNKKMVSPCEFNFDVLCCDKKMHADEMKMIFEERG